MTTRDTPEAALAAALRAVLRDFDRDPTDEYLIEAQRIFLAALPPGWCGHDERAWGIVANAAEAEIARLRAALKRIADGVEWPLPLNRTEVAFLARAALAAAPSEP